MFKKIDGYYWFNESSTDKIGYKKLSSLIYWHYANIIVPVSVIILSAIVMAIAIR